MKICEQGCCIECGVCAAVCPVQCITWREDSWGERTPFINSEQCIGCGLCANRCPAAKMPRAMRPQEVYAAYSLDLEERRRCSSGGAATVFARRMVSSGGAVFGASFERDGQVSHRCVTDEEGIEALQGSKYVRSDLGDSYHRIHKKLMRGQEVLFIGAPCQVDGLYAYLENDFERLTTMDFVCHGAPAPRYFREHLQCLEQKAGRKSDEMAFRGEKGYCLILSQDGQPFYEQDRSRDLYYRAFLSNLLCRDCCIRCPYASTARVSDITVGDFWGLGEERPFLGDPDGGVSEVLINTRKGERLLDLCKKELYLEHRTLEEARLGNKQLQGPPAPHPMREAFRRRYRRVGFERAASRCLNYDWWPFSFSGKRNRKNKEGTAR